MYDPSKKKQEKKTHSTIVSRVPVFEVGPICYTRIPYGINRRNSIPMAFSMYRYFSDTIFYIHSSDKLRGAFKKYQYLSRQSKQLTVSSSFDIKILIWRRRTRRESVLTYFKEANIKLKALR